MCHLSNDKRKTEMKIKILSEWEREEIFFVRWFTFIVATLISIPIWIIFFNLNKFVALAIILINIFVPPLCYFRKPIGGYVKEKIIYWWTMINGEIP